MPRFQLRNTHHTKTRKISNWKKKKQSIDAKTEKTDVRIIWQRFCQVKAVIIKMLHWAIIYIPETSEKIKSISKEMERLIENIKKTNECQNWKMKYLKLKRKLIDGCNNRMEGTGERIMKQNTEQQTLHNLKNQRENRLEKMIRFSGTCETIIKDLVFMSLESGKQRRNRVVTKNYLKNIGW